KYLPNIVFKLYPNVVASPLKPDVVINGDCRHCNVHGG
ncbi:hypothetical protein KR044_001155, partial [Drosophila immigrans]